MNKNTLKIQTVESPNKYYYNFTSATTFNFEMN